MNGFENDFGAGSMEPQKVPVGDKFVLPFCGFVHPDGRQFKAWQVKGREYDPGDEITVNENLTVWAMWQPETPETESEDITGELPSEDNDTGEETSPAEVLIYGPDAVVREDPDVAPEVEIIKYDDIEDLKDHKGYEELKGYANNNKQNYVYYEISLENAEIKEGAEIEVKFYFGTQYKNRKVVVLHYCSSCNKLEKDENLKVGEDGYVTIKVHSFSPFAVALDDTPDVPVNFGGRNKDTDVRYNGGNTFSTSKSAVPTAVEIDGVPVSFVGDGKLFTVDCIQPGSHWITVRWHSTSVTTNFTADVTVTCIPNAIPKTGDMSVIGYALMAVIAAAGAMLRK